MSVLAGGKRRRDPVQQPRARPSVGSVPPLRARRDAARRADGDSAREAAPRGRALAGAMLYGAFGIGGAFALAYYGLVDVHAGLGQTVLALVPLATLFLVVLQRQERLRLERGNRRSARPGGNRRHVRRNRSGRRPGTLAPRSRRQRAVLCPGRHTRPQVSAGPPRGDERRRHGHGCGAALGGFAAGTRDLRAAAASGNVARARLSRSRRVRPRLRALSRRAPVLGSITSCVRVRSHPVVTVVLSAWLDNEPLGLGLLIGGPLVLLGVYVGALRRG